jgi:UrcA family protein
MNEPFQPSAFIQEQTMRTMTTSTCLRGLITSAIFGALAAGFTGVSTAGDTTVRSITVKYGDLNLSNPQGAATLYSRIVRAAHEVCELPDDSLSFRADARACLHKAIADAVTKVGHPELIAVYNANNREPLPATVAQNR